MPGEDQSLNATVEKLAQELEKLAERVQFLYSYLRVPSPESMAAGGEGLRSGPADEEIIKWAHRASLLPRVSTLCFLLVIALVLRTLTDNNVIDTGMGSMIGMGYAAVLMLVGHYKYRKSSRLAPVFAVCGAVLMYSIVLETHQRFHFLPSVPAYAILMGTGMGTAVTTYLFGAPLPMLAGVFGMCMASAVIDYPNPFFPFPVAVLFVANVLGHMVPEVRRSSWIRWILLLVTIFMVTWWSTKLGIALAKEDEEQPALLALHWFFPCLSVFALFYPLVSIMGILRKGTRGISRLDAALPTLSAVWAFATAYQVANAWGASGTLVGFAGASLAGGHLGAAHWLATRRLEGAPGTNAFAVAGSVLFGFSLPVAIGSQLMALLLLSAIAFGLAFLAGVWKSGGVRLTSYLLQLYTGIAVALLLLGNRKVSFSIIEASLAGALSCIGILHYRWCRQNGPTTRSSVFFSRYDRKDRAAILVLIGSLLSGFFALRAGIHEGLALASGDFENSFRCAQTILINVTATGLMLYAYLWADEEVRNVAILVTLVGAVRVFLFDLPQARGLPLVLSVFSFGLAALLESAVLGRWQRRTKAALQRVAELPGVGEMKTAKNFPDSL